ncbi:MAG: glycosyltransferase family 2 protein [Desulfurococcales archaeon]|nr:glycosyltransferase family 2 protein [Desulfurococcales archaeon]
MRSEGVGSTVSIIIPTYNEAEVIERTLEEISKVMEQHGIDYEIIVVDDNSPDGTWRIVEEYSKRNPRVKLYRRTSKRGLASAIIDGMKLAKSKYIVVMDADLQHHPKYIPSLLREADASNADIVVASRYAKGGGVSNWSYTRLLISKTAAVLAKLLVKEAQKTSDPMSGFFLVKREFIQRYIDELRPRGYKILLEILARAGDAKVSEVPYTFYPRAAGRSKLGIKEIVDYLIHLIKLSKFIKFGTVGASGTIVNLAVMYVLLKMLGIHKAISSIAGIEAGLLWNFLLNEVWTFEAGFRGAWWKRIIAYHGASAASIVTTFATMYLLSSYLGIDPVEAQFYGIILGFIANYLLSSRGVWRLGYDSRNKPRQ